jgi:hypothetical protein
MMKGETSSWRRGKAVAFWSFRTCERGVGGKLPACPEGSEALSKWLAERIRRVAHALAPFGTLEQLVIETRTGGENACKLQGSQASILRKFEEFAARESGIVAAHLTLTLHCIGADGKSFRIVNGARVVIEPPFDEHGEVIENDDGIDLRLTLNIDIYSPRNPCPQRDNTRLAMLNGPLLSGFIARLEAEVPCQFELASGDGYIDFISGRGFELSKPPESDA